MDVLLQRLGRLHRHPRARPRGFEAARAAVLVPASRDLSVLLNGHGGRWGLGSVYEDMRILEATWRQLEAHPIMTIPLMNRALVEHSTHPAVLSQITRELGGSWGKHETAMSGKAIAHRIFGGQATFDWNTAPQEQAGRFAGTERPSTRLGENDRNAELPRGTIGPFGREIRRLSFPGYLVSETPVDATIMNLSQLGRSLRFDYGPASFVYDRLGLRPDDGTAA